MQERSALGPVEKKREQPKKTDSYNEQYWFRISMILYSFFMLISMKSMIFIKNPWKINNKSILIIKIVMPPYKFFKNLIIWVMSLYGYRTILKIGLVISEQCVLVIWIMLNIIYRALWDIYKNLYIYSLYCAMFIQQFKHKFDIWQYLLAQG